MFKTIKSVYSYIVPGLTEVYLLKNDFNRVHSNLAADLRSMRTPNDNDTSRYFTPRSLLSLTPREYVLEKGIYLNISMVLFH